MLTRDMAIYIAFQVLYQVTAVFLVIGVGPSVVNIPNFKVLEKSDVPKHGGISKDDPRYQDFVNNEKVLTMSFAAFVFMQVANIILARQLEHELNPFRRFLRNPIFVFMVTTIVVVQVLVVQFAGDFAKTLPLNGAEWGVCIVVAAVQIPYIIACRLGYRLWRSHRESRKEHAKEISDVSANVSADANASNASNANATATANATTNPTTNPTTTGNNLTVPSPTKAASVRSVGSGNGSGTSSVILEIPRSGTNVASKQLNLETLRSLLERYGLNGYVDPHGYVLIMVATAPRNLPLKPLDARAPDASVAAAAAAFAASPATSRWTKVRSATFFLGHYFNVADEAYEGGKGPDESFILSVRKFRY